MVALKEPDGGVARAVAEILLERQRFTGWHMQAIADELGWAKSSVFRYLHAQRPLPLDGFYVLSRLLALKPSDVLREAEERASTTGQEGAPS